MYGAGCQPNGFLQVCLPGPPHQCANIRRYHLLDICTIRHHGYSSLKQPICLNNIGYTADYLNDPTECPYSLQYLKLYLNSQHICSEVTGNFANKCLILMYVTNKGTSIIYTPVQTMRYCNFRTSFIIFISVWVHFCRTNCVKLTGKQYSLNESASVLVQPVALTEQIVISINTDP